MQKIKIPKNKQIGWEKAFRDEFSIHFHDSDANETELKFCLAFIEEEIAKARQEGYEEGRKETAIEVDTNFADWLMSLKGMKMLKKAKETARQEGYEAGIKEVEKDNPTLKGERRRIIAEIRQEEREHYEKELKIADDRWKRAEANLKELEDL